MNNFEADVYFELAQQALAFKTLKDPRANGEMDPEQLLETIKAAGFPEEVAQEAARKRAEQRLDHELPVFATSYVHQ